MLNITSAKLLAFSLIMLNICLVSAAQILLKFSTGSLGTLKESKNIINILGKIISNPYLVSGTTCYVLSLILWVYILTKAQLSIAYPLMSLSYVTVMILSVLFFKENINFAQWIGALLIVAGTSLIFIFK